MELLRRHTPRRLFSKRSRDVPLTTPSKEPTCRPSNTTSRQRDVADRDFGQILHTTSQFVTLDDRPFVKTPVFAFDSFLKRSIDGS